MSEIKTFFNASHYSRVRQARKERGLPLQDLHVEEPNHPLSGKKIKNIETGKVYNVERVFREFYLGWFYKAVIECNKSHGVVFFETITCKDDVILKQIERFRKEYIVVEDKMPYRTYQFVTKFGDFLGTVGTPGGLKEAADMKARGYMECSGGYEIPGQVLVAIEENGKEIMRCLYSYLKDGPVNLTPLEASLLPFLKDYKEVQQFDNHTL
jgi:hypothetical protein